MYFGIRLLAPPHCLKQSLWEESVKMPHKLAEMKAQLADLAPVLNSFKSEAVQLRLLEFLLGTSEGKEDIETPNNGGKGSGVSKRTKRRPPTPKAASSTPATEKPAKKRAGASGTGANATLNQMLKSDFFNKYQTIGDIVQHCKDNLARNFKANEFSSKLGRMVRDKELIRKKNAESQYEYKKP